MTAPDLLRCPFCRGEAHIDGTSWRPSDGKEVAWVTCKACGAYGPTLPVKEAIAAWNTRATPVAVTPDEVEHAPLPEAAIHGMRAIAANMDARNVLSHPQVNALVEAAEPLAAMAGRYDPEDGDGDLECWSGLAVPKIKHIRALRAALAALRAGGDAHGGKDG